MAVVQPPADPLAGRGGAAVVRARRRRLPPVLVVAAALVLAAVVVVAIAGPALAPYPPDLQRFQDGRLLAPGAHGHLLGTDQLARDLLSRLLVGARMSLGIAVGSVAAGLVVGLALGIVSGYRGGVVDAVLMRIVDGILAFPTLVLALVIAVGLGPSTRNTIVAIAVVMVPGFARLARAQTRQIAATDYVAAARVTGARFGRIAFVHVLPNMWGPMVTQAVLALGFAIPAEATLSFLGLGVQVPTPSWGNMIADGYNALSRSAWVLLLPAGAIVLTVASASIVSDALGRRLARGR